MKQRIAFALIIIAFAMSGALHYRERTEMKQRIAFALIIIAFAMSGALHYREYRKSQEISDILRIQAEIEFKRTSLMVVYQEVLQSVVKELDTMKHGRIEAESQELSRLLDSLPDEIELQEAQP